MSTVGQYTQVARKLSNKNGYNMSKVYFLRIVDFDLKTTHDG